MVINFPVLARLWPTYACAWWHTRETPSQGRTVLWILIFWSPLSPPSNLGWRHPGFGVAGSGTIYWGKQAGKRQERHLRRQGTLDDLMSKERGRFFWSVWTWFRDRLGCLVFWSPWIKSCESKWWCNILGLTTEEKVSWKIEQRFGVCLCVCVCVPF